MRLSKKVSMYLELQGMRLSDFTETYTDEYGLTYLMNPEPSIFGLNLTISLDGGTFEWVNPTDEPTW